MEGVSDKPELRGIIPNSFVHIFGHISKAEDNKRFLVRVSYFEIYKEQIRDLLAKKGDRDRAGNANILEIKEDKLKGSIPSCFISIIPTNPFHINALS